MSIVGDLFIMCFGSMISESSAQACTSHARKSAFSLDFVPEFNHPCIDSSVLSCPILSCSVLSYSVLFSPHVQMFVVDWKEENLGELACKHASVHPSIHPSTPFCARKLVTPRHLSRAQFLCYPAE